MAAIIGALRVDLSANVAKFQADMGKASTVLVGFGNQASKIGAQMKRTGVLLSAALTVPLLAVGGAVLKVGADFEAGMNRVQAATGASAETFKQMEGLAEELGRTTAFSATAAAEGMEVLAKNGLRAEAILGGATDATLLLASATDTELANAADIATDAMLNFNKQAGELGGVVDQITGVLFNSKFGIDDYRRAIAQAGGVAGGMKVPFEEFNAVIAATSPAFASGSDAGTSFKTFLTRLAPVSKQAADLQKQLGLEFFDNAGNLRAMADIAEELKVKLGGLNQEAKTTALTTLFGTDSMRTAILLMAQGKDGIQAMQEQIAQVSAQEQAEARLKGFNGQMKLLVSALQGLAIAIAKSGFLEFMTGMITSLTNVISNLAKADPALLKLGVTIAAVAATLGPLLVALGFMSSGLGVAFRLIAPLLGGLTALRAGLAATGLSFGALGSAILIVGPLMAAWFLDKEGSYQKFWSNRGKELGIYLAKLKYGAAEVEGALERIRQAELKEFAISSANAAREARQEKERQAALAKTLKDLEDLAAGIENVETGTGTLDLFSGAAEEIKALRAEIFPLETALEDYSAGLKQATAAGISLEDATAGLAKKAYDAAGGYEFLKDKIVDLPPAIQKLFEADKALADLEVAKIADRLGRQVVRLDRQIADMGKGSVTALEQNLNRTAQQYRAMRENITGLIEQNKALADSSPAVAAQLAMLEAQLLSLDGAYRSATDAVVAQDAAQQALANASAAAAASDTGQAIRDLKQARGDSGPMADRAAELQSIEDDLFAKRMDSARRLLEFQVAIDEATRAGDSEELARLETLMGLESEYQNELLNTTAKQIEGARMVQDIYSEAINSIADSLSGMIMNWKGDLAGLVNIFKDLAQKQFVTPFLQGGLESGGSILKDFFAGGFASGGTINAGQWGIAGENGPEPIFAGNRDLQVQSNGGGRPIVNMTVNTPNADSFRRSEAQIAQGLKRKLESGS